MTATTAENAVPAARQSRSRERIAWIDVAKGFSIVMVVLHHSYLFGYGEIFTWHIFEPAVIRMPVFFMASGLTLSFALGLPRLAFLRRRVLPVLWIYVVWTLIYAAFNDNVTTLFPWANDRHSTPLWRTVYWPYGNLWFVWILAAFTVFAGLSRTLPRLPVVMAAYLAAIAGDIGLVRWESFPGLMGLFITYLPFFLTGALYSNVILRLSSDLKRCLLIGGGAVLVLIVISLIDPLGPSTLTLRYAAGAVIGLVLSILMARSRTLERFFSWLGHRSLAIFVGHQLFLASILGFLWSEPWFREWFSGWPVILAGLGAIFGSLLLQALLMRLGLRWLYTPPRDLFSLQWLRSR